MNEKLQDENLDSLFKAILTLQTTDECYRFFEDLCTVPELKAMAQMLTERHIYTDIVSRTGASTATISRVARALNYGSDGYALVFDRLGICQQEEPQEN